MKLIPCLSNVKRKLKELKGNDSETKKFEIIKAIFEKKIKGEFAPIILDLLKQKIRMGLNEKTIIKILKERVLIFSTEERKTLESIFREKLTDEFELFFPCRFMLSKSSSCFEDVLKWPVLKKNSEIFVEEKLDGERIQV